MSAEASSPLHPARHFSMWILSRSEGRSSVCAAAYIGRTKIEDRRTGLSHDSRHKPGLLLTGLVNWDDGQGASLWNGLEKVETRINARVGRELRIALPKELPLEEQARLVRSYCLWLKNQYGLACQWAIHAPTFHDEDLGERFWSERSTPEGPAAYMAALSDPAQTNLNFHVHILLTGRAVDRVSRTFGRKIREFDHIVEGPAHVENMRREWQERTNRRLKAIGSEAKVDLLSYETMAAAGDAPEDLVAQEHMGANNTARSRKLAKQRTGDTSEAGRRRRRAQKHNEEVWTYSLQLRALRREKLRQEESAKIAADREARRRAEEIARKSAAAKSVGHAEDQHPGMKAGRSPVSAPPPATTRTPDPVSAVPASAPARPVPPRSSEAATQSAPSGSASGILRNVRGVARPAPTDRSTTRGDEASSHPASSQRSTAEATVEAGAKRNVIQRTAPTTPDAVRGLEGTAPGPGATMDGGASVPASPSAPLLSKANGSRPTSGIGIAGPSGSSSGPASVAPQQSAGATQPISGGLEAPSSAGGPGDASASRYGLRTRDPMEDILEEILREGISPPRPVEGDFEVDPETYVAPGPDLPHRGPLRVKSRGSKQPVRTR